MRVLRIKQAFFLVALLFSTFFIFNLGCANITTSVESEHGDLKITAEAKDCQASLVYSQKSAFIQYLGVQCGGKDASQWGMKMKQQVPFLRALLHRLFAEVRVEPAYSFALLDRLRGYPEMSQRLESKLWKYAEWDAEKGRLKTEHMSINRFIQEVVNRERMYPELEEVFKEFDLRLTVAGVEKVLVGPTYTKGSTPLWFPYDFMFWFRVERILGF